MAYPYYQIPGADKSQQETPAVEPEEPVEEESSPEDAYYNSMQNRPDANSIGIIRELDPKNQLLLIRHQLNGEIWDDVEKKYKKVFDAVMSKEGISKYLSLLAGCTALTTFSNHTPREIYTLAELVASNATMTYHIYWKEFGIKDKSSFDILDNITIMATFSALKKSLLAGDRSVIGRTISESIMSRAVPQETRKKSMWDRLPIGGK